MNILHTYIYIKNIQYLCSSSVYRILEVKPNSIIYIYMLFWKFPKRYSEIRVIRGCKKLQPWKRKELRFELVKFFFPIFKTALILHPVGYKIRQRKMCYCMIVSLDYINFHNFLSVAFSA